MKALASLGRVEQLTAIEGNYELKIYSSRSIILFMFYIHVRLYTYVGRIQ